MPQAPAAEQVQDTEVKIPTSGVLIPERIFWEPTDGTIWIQYTASHDMPQKLLNEILPDKAGPQWSVARATSSGSVQVVIDQKSELGLDMEDEITLTRHNEGYVAKPGKMREALDTIVDVLAKNSSAIDKETIMKQYDQTVVQGRELRG